MAFTVEDALGAAVFQNCRLLTGRAGLQNEIRSVNILEILDDLSHIEPGEFLITTAYNLDQDNESERRRLFERLAGKRLAALAIQTGHYISEIDPSLIGLAAGRGIPLIEIPPEASFKSMTRTLLGELLRREGAVRDGAPPAGGEIEQEKLRQGGELLRRLLAGEDPLLLKDSLAALAIEPAAPFLIVLAKVKPAGTQTGEPGTHPEQALARLLIQVNLPFLITPDREMPAVLLQPGKTGGANIATAARLLLNELALLHPELSCRAGMSASHHGLAAVPDARAEAAVALRALELGLAGDSGLLSYSDLGLYRLLLEVENRRPLHSLCAETVAPLLEYDNRTGGALLPTLRAYLKHGSAGGAARALFIHRHTMKYRLGQIRELTGLDPGAPGQAFLLNVGLHVYDYLEAGKV